jgi:transcriptional regulator with XRE-family HTH domain
MKKPYHIKVLLREIEKRKQKNNRYSLRAFANFLDMAPSTLSRILTNGQELSVSATKKIMKKIQLTEDEKFLFIASVAEEKKLRTLLTLAKLSTDTEKDFKFTLESIANLAMKHFSDGCIIHLTNSHKESILHAKHKDNHFNGHNFNLMSAPIVCHPVLSPDRPMFINEHDEHKEILEHLNASSLLCVPVKKGEKKFGAITFLRTKNRKDFCEDDLTPALDFSSKTAYVYEILSEM